MTCGLSLSELGVYMCVCVCCGGNAPQWGAGKQGRALPQECPVQHTRTHTHLGRGYKYTIQMGAAPASEGYSAKVTLHGGGSREWDTAAGEDTARERRLDGVEKRRRNRAEESVDRAGGTVSSRSHNLFQIIHLAVNNISKY